MGAEAAVVSSADVIWHGGRRQLPGTGRGRQPRGTAMVVVPAGTRNYMAHGPALDRGDFVGALDAFGAAQNLVAVHPKCKNEVTPAWA